jgi:hypothetical protein
LSWQRILAGASFAIAVSFPDWSESPKFALIIMSTSAASATDASMRWPAPCDWRRLGHRRHGTQRPSQHARARLHPRVDLGEQCRFARVPGRDLTAEPSPATTGGISRPDEENRSARTGPTDRRPISTAIKWLIACTGGYSAPKTPCIPRAFFSPPYIHNVPGLQIHKCTYSGQRSFSRCKPLIRIGIKSSPDF